MSKALVPIARDQSKRNENTEGRKWWQRFRSRLKLPAIELSLNLAAAAWLIVLGGYAIAILVFFLLKPEEGVTPALQVCVIIACFVTAYTFYFCEWIKSPHCGREYRKGKFIYAVGPGLHLGIPYYRHIEQVDRNWIQASFEDNNLNPINDIEEGVKLAKRASSIKTGGEGKGYVDQAKASGVVQFRVKNDAESLGKSLAMDQESMKKQIDDLCRSQLHTVISGSRVSWLLTNVSKIVSKIEAELEKFCLTFGYEYAGFELNLVFSLQDQRAEGRTRAANARDMSGAIKDNTQVASVQIARDLVTGAERIVKIMKDGSSTTEENISDVSQTLKNIADRMGA